ncbi:hypothetical protein G3M54_34650 [Bacillus megaterium NBRC 15308 = ATCC 14581]|nr:hypothetical protein [Priestia megaterium NBRC 15308 = ATCC 14581]
MGTRVSYPIEIKLKAIEMRLAGVLLVIRFFTSILLFLEINAIKLKSKCSNSSST